MDIFWGKIREALKGQVPYRLRDYGVNQNDSRWLADQCFTKERMGNNVIELNRGQVEQILEKVY